MTALYGPAFLDGSSVGPFEVLIILMAVLILFGPDRLPEIARNLGRMMSNFRRASDDLKGQIMRLDRDIERPDSPNIAGPKTIVVKQSEHSSPRLSAPPVDVTPEPELTVPETEVKPDSGDPA